MLIYSGACELRSPLESMCPLRDDILREPERRGSMGRRARGWAVEHFSWGVIVKRLEGIFHGLAN